LRELHVRRGDFELYLSRFGERGLCGGPARVPVAPAPVAAPAAARAGRPCRAGCSAATAGGAVPADAIIVCAPNLGTFYRSPKPGAPAYVEIGSMVSPGDELCLIE
jgi:acetyl-CoA carboxylase biotin carboxyl carrier protein